MGIFPLRLSDLQRRCSICVRDYGAGSVGRLPGAASASHLPGVAAAGLQVWSSSPAAAGGLRAHRRQAPPPSTLRPPPPPEAPTRPRPPPSQGPPPPAQAPGRARWPRSSGRSSASLSGTPALRPRRQGLQRLTAVMGLGRSGKSTLHRAIAADATHSLTAPREVVQCRADVRRGLCHVLGQVISLKKESEVQKEVMNLTSLQDSCQHPDHRFLPKSVRGQI